MADNTTYQERFRDTVEIFCKEKPPIIPTEAWLFDGNDDEKVALQDWVRSHLEIDWMQAITVIEACVDIANDPHPHYK